jgi:cyanophycinase-like exopeptidase
MTRALITGPLVIIGGSEDYNEERKILREFVNLSGPNASIVIITVASESQAEVGSPSGNFY